MEIPLLRRSPNAERHHSSQLVDGLPESSPHSDDSQPVRQDRNASVDQNCLTRLQQRWEKKKASSSPLRMAIQVASIVLFCAKLAWAIILSIKVSGYYDQLQRIQTDLHASSRMMNNISLSVTALETTLHATAQKVSSVSSSVDNLLANMASLQLGMTQLEAKMTTMFDALHYLKNESAVLRDQVESTVADVDNMTTSISNLTMQLANLTGGMAYLNNQTTLVESRVANATVAINHTIATVNVAVQQFNTTVEQNRQQVEIFDQLLFATSSDHVDPVDLVKATVTVVGNGLPQHVRWINVTRSAQLLLYQEACGCLAPLYFNGTRSIWTNMKAWSNANGYVDPPQPMAIGLMALRRGVYEVTYSSLCTGTWNLWFGAYF